MGYRVLKIGLPKLRLSRKLLIITLGMTMLLGGTSVAALYFSKDMGMDGAENSVGGECTDVQTMVQKTPSNRLWLRRFIRMENASGPDRVRTALRIAGLLAKKNAVDLIHVSVLDSHGPTLRSEMRARSIGAEVLIALKPDNLPDMKSPAMASYYEGPVSEQGRYYGDKVVLDIDEIGQMMTAMRSIEEKPDCVSPEAAEDAEAAASDHGKKEEKADHGKKPEEHGAKPEESEGDKSTESHGEEPAKDGTEEHANAEAPAKEQSFLDSMLSMVGLGGGEEKAATEQAPDMSHAVAEEPEADGHGDKTAAEGHEPASEDASHAEKPADTTTDDKGEKPAAEHDAKATDHGAEPVEENAEQAAEDASPAEAKDAAASEDHGEKPASEHDAKAESHGKKPAAKAEDHSAAQTDADEVKPGHDTEKAAPASAEDGHSQPVKKKADEHAEAVMPVGD